jgi:acyl-CoA thioesterase
MTSENASGETRQPAPEEQRVAQLCAQALLAGDEASRTLGMRLEDVRPGSARLQMVVRPDMVNGHGMCHGGIVFALADSAFAVACNTYNAVTVAAAAAIDFLAPARVNDELTAQARELWRSKRSGIYEIVVSNQRGEPVALFRGRSHCSGGQIVPDAAVQSLASQSREP